MADKKDKTKETPEETTKAKSDEKGFRKNYFLKGLGRPVGKGTIVTDEHRKDESFKDSMTE